MTKNAFEDLQDLIQEAKLRTVWWILCIFAVTYFLTHTSKSMLMNFPIAILLISGLRILFNEVEFHWKVRNTRPTSYLSYLERKQLSVNDSRLSMLPSPQKWKRKIDSPVVEAAIEDFVDKILQDFVIDLWYSDITPDKEAPALIHDIVMDVLGEVSTRIKEVNLVDLLTRDAVDLIGDHIDLFRRNQSAIGMDVMGTLSSEERDERLKQHLMASKELHPALISPECEYKVIQQLMGGLLAVVLRPREAQCPLVRCIARELLTCLVMQPIMNFASPVYVNELIEYIILAYNEGFKDFATDHSSNVESHNSDVTNVSLSGSDDNRELEMQDEPIHPHSADWAKVFEAATQRRTEVLMPENLENMWSIGRHYKKKLPKKAAPELQTPEVTSPASIAFPRSDLVTEVPKEMPETSIGIEDTASKQLKLSIQQDTQPTDLSIDALSRSQDLNKKVLSKEHYTICELENTVDVVCNENRIKLERSNSAANLHDLNVQAGLENMLTIKGNAPIITKSLSADVDKLNVHSLNTSSDITSQSEVLHVPKLRCRVLGAYFEKLGSNSFAVYSIAVTDADNTTWIVKRRYRNFERLHRHLKDIPNYTLHLPPKRIFSSSTEDAFVHQRCIQLDKYLQDLLSIPNVAEQHEVWDFLSASSKNYSFVKSSSVMTTLAVNVDEAVDDIVRQFREVSDGLMRIVVGSPTSSHEPASSVISRNLSCNADDINKLAMRRSTSDSLNSFSDNEEGNKDANHGPHEIESPTHANGCHSDNESKEDPTGVPPEWTPPNLSVPVLNLVDNIFQLKRRGWLRRQVFWISKQILQLIMEDAIDDWLLRQIQWLRREDVIAQGIRWVQDILWPNGTFFTTLRIQEKLSGNQANQGSQTTGKQGRRRAARPGSFEQQLEAARRASDVKNMIFICLKQLGYGILELGLISVFPELRDLVRDIHEKMHMQPAHI
ncbi:Intermediate filament-like protein [Handroanthus impetiginosus]|uniref:Intermediate filament-like protein n=1 Tax=Handroanthus impetiginosus TaxID=429701 RepID=A0A2G9GSJ4_9LAMI|nr:Intermediate filament-like protein [Handroanthus impetiginosus]